MVTFIFSWSLWITALLMLHLNNLPLFINEHIFLIFEPGFKNFAHLALNIMVYAGVFGPLVGYLVVRKNAETNPFKSISSSKIVIFVIGFPLLISLIPGLLDQVLSNGQYNLALPIVTIVPYFIYQLFTSGTEEFGWRGLFFPHLLKNNPAIEAGWKTGWVWAAWHIPLILFFYKDLDISLIFTTILGFSFNIVGMAIIYAFLYVNSKSIVLMAIFHALSNTFSIYFMGSTSNPTLGLIPAAIVWITVFLLHKKLGDNLLLGNKLLVN